MSTIRIRTLSCVVRTVLVSAWLAALVGPAAAESLTKVSIGLSSASLPAAGARIAKQMGLFEQHGIDASVTPMDSGSVATMALISGSIAFSTSSPTDVVLSQAHGQDMVAVTSIYRGIAAVLVLAKPVADQTGVAPDAPIIRRLKALDGLRIATPSATSVFTWALKPAAASAGAKVVFVYMDQPAMVAALQTGAIDGFMASSPFYGTPVVNGSGVIWLNGPRQEFPPALTPANAVTLNVLRSFALAHRDLVRRVSDVFADLAKAVKDRPNDVKAAMAKLFPSIEPHTLDVLFETEAAGYATTPLDAAAMAHEIAFLKASNVNLPGLDRIDPAQLVLSP